jgi:hypothetical protein
MNPHPSRASKKKSNLHQASMSNTRNDLADLSESTLTSDAGPKDVFSKTKRNTNISWG